MNIKHLPAIFLVVGLASKTALILVWKFFRVPFLLNLVINWDPGAFHFAERISGWFFDQRRLAPSPAESMVFELFLVVGFGIECLLLGLLLQWLFLRFRSGDNVPSVPTVR